VGGIIGGFPSTVAISLFFLGLARSPEYVVTATEVFPAAFALNGAFIGTYVVLSEHGMSPALLGATGVWLVLQATLVHFGPHEISFSLFLWAAVLLGSFYAAEYRGKIRSHRGVAQRHSAAQLAARALFSGSVIALVVFVGSVSGPVVGGVLSSFPAVFLSTLFIEHRLHGPAFARGLAKSLLLAALINCVVYALAVRYLYPLLGLVLGTILAIVITLVSTYGTHRFFSGRLS